MAALNPTPSPPGSISPKFVTNWNVEILFQPVPFWPSLAHIEPNIENIIKSIYPHAKKVSVNEIASKSKTKQTVWFFLPSSTQAITLQLLRHKYKSVYDRPRGVFFLNGEGAKLAFTLFHFQDTFRNDDQFFVASESEKAAILEWTEGLQDRIKVCPYPVNTKIFNTKPASSSLQSLNLPKKKKLILYSGRISDQKNILQLLDHCVQYPSHHLILAGDIDSFGFPHLAGIPKLHFPQELAKKILEKGLTNRIQFVPCQSQRSLSDLMKICDLQISFSTHYGEDFGYSIAQGLACGLPTLMTSWGGHRTWLKMKKLGLIDSGHPIQFVSPYFKRSSNSKTVEAKPVFKKNLKIPKGKITGVGEWLESEVKSQIKKAVENPPSAPNGEQLPSLNLAPQIIAYWKKQATQPSQYMYSSTKDLLYKKVLKFYGAEFL